MTRVQRDLVGGLAKRALQRRSSTLIGGAAVMASVSLIMAPGASAFFQLPDATSPESGTAQVVAQGVANIVGGDLRWEVIEQTAPPPANATPVTSELGFIVVESGVLLVEDLDTGEQHRLPAGEAVMTEEGVSQNRAALGSDNAVYFDVSLVNANAGDEQALFSSDPFTGPDARHDIDLMQDVLAPGGTLNIPAGALPTLILVTEGAAQVTTEGGDVVSLGDNEAIALTGALVVTAGEAGSSLTAAYTGPAVPRLGEAAPRERAVSTPEAVAQALPAATPAVIETEPAAASAVDEDGDGLSTRQEARENTDPALADTDEDGLTDGEEVLTYGTAPLAPDTDGDGILDGDEVAQGTDPKNVGTTEVVAEPTPGASVETEADASADSVDASTPAESADTAAPAVAGDSDGDGLEDEIEIQLGTDPYDPDTDDDGATDGDEYYVLATGTRNPDSDGDGVLDGDEAANGTNPNDINSN